MAYYDDVPMQDNSGNTHYPRTKYNSVYNADGTERLDNKLAAMEAVIASKANSSTVVTGTLTAAGWIGSAAPYTQTLTVTGVTTTNNVIFDLGMSVTSTQLNAAIDAKLKATAQAANSVTIKAFGDKPTVDIPVQFLILG